MQFLPDEVRLWIASDGPDTNRLQRTTEGDTRIEWLGRISEEEKAERLQQSSLFCAPSLGGESFGIVLLEAMASKTLVVASDIPGYSKLTRGGKDALLFKAGDATVLSKVLTKGLYDSGISQPVVESAFSRVGNFSMDKLADRYMDIYQRAVTQKPAVPLAKGGKFFSQRSLTSKNFRIR
jgi:phosphatidylinositol alpha-mannosyltransferase